MTYQLLVEADGKRETVEFTVEGWDGENHLHAIERYVDLHRGHVVLAWRYPQVGVWPLGNATIIG